MRVAFILLVACGATQPGPVVEPVETTGEEQPEARLSLGHYQSLRPAANVRWEMDSADELTQSGWHHHGAGNSAFANGLLTTSGTSYEEWMQRPDDLPSDWWRTIDNERGWAIETRLRVLRASPDCGSLGLWIHDGARMLKVYFRDGSIGIDRAREWVSVDTRQWHEYRIEGRVDWIRLLVDGDVVFEERSERMNSGPSGGSKTLMLGDLGGCQGSEAEWDWFAYDTGPRLEDVECPYCGATESFRIAQLRERMRSAGGPTPNAPGTRDTNEVCLAYVALDHVAREITPLLPTNDYPHMRDAMRQAPHVRDASSAGELARYIRRSLNPSQKPARAMRPPPSRRAPDWYNPLMRAAELLQRRELDPAWRVLSDIGTSAVSSNDDASRATANLLDALINAARGECAR